MESQLLSTKQVAELLGISYATARAWVSARRLPFYRLGRTVRFDLKKVQAWLAEQEVREVRFDER